MLETGSHTVLVFVKLQFQKKWTRFSGTQMIAYTAAEPGQLVAVAEGETGVKTTYFFNLEAGHEVWVIENVVHIPAICIKSAPGDEARCIG